MNLSLSRRFAAGFAATAVALVTTACGGGGDTAGDFDGEIKVGILHSLSGTMAISETTLKETEEMAIKEINSSGGVKIDGKAIRSNRFPKMALLIGPRLPRSLRS